MRIGIVLYKFGSEADFGTHLGSFHYLVKKIKLLGESEHQIFVIAPWVSLWRKGSTSIGKVTIIRYWPPLFNQPKLLPIHLLLRWCYQKATQRTVLRTVKRHQLEVVYVRQARETGFAVAQIKHKLGVPFIFRQITAWHWHFARPISRTRSLLVGRAAQIRYAQTIYRQADKLVFSTNGAARAEVDLGLDLHKVVLLPEAVEPDVYVPATDKSLLRQQLGLPSAKIALYVGRLNIAEKGIDYLIDAAAVAVKQIPDLHVLIVGGGSVATVAQLQTRIEKLRVERSVGILGKKPFADIPHYIAAADVVVVPSVWMEAFGRITVEAMSCGVPVITTDTGGSPEVNINRQTGLIVPAKDSQQLADAISNILSNQPLADRLGQAGRQRVLENYTYERVVKAFFDIIAKAVNH